MSNKPTIALVQIGARGPHIGPQKLIDVIHNCHKDYEEEALIAEECAPRSLGFPTPGVGCGWCLEHLTRVLITYCVAHLGRKEGYCSVGNMDIKGQALKAHACGLESDVNGQLQARCQGCPSPATTKDQKLVNKHVHRMYTH